MKNHPVKLFTKALESWQTVLATIDSLYMETEKSSCSDEKLPGKNNNQLNLFTKTSACSRFRNSRESADMRKRVAKKHVELAFGVPFLFVPTLLYESLEQATKILGS